MNRVAIRTLAGLASASLSCAALLLTSPIAAQDGNVERHDFAGGQLTIEETRDYEKIVAFNGRELARDYAVFFDRIADIGGTEVAFVYVGPGGNACSPSVLMVWQSDQGDVETATNDEDCATPAPAVTGYDVFFVPHVIPGQSAEVKAWNPSDGFRIQGTLTYTPDAGTGWDDFEPGAVSYPLDLFRNAALYDAATRLLGPDLNDVAMGLGVSSAPEVGQDGLVAARGCVPHACGLGDTFMVVDKRHKALFFAKQDEESGTRFWPGRGNWPAAIAALVPDDF